MTLTELHEVFGKRIEITLKDGLSEEGRAQENEQTKIIIGLGKQMINNGQLILQYEKALAQNKTLKHSVLAGIIGEQTE